MSRVQAPIHVEGIEGVRVRYFSSPEYLERRSPDLAWHAATTCGGRWGSTTTSVVASFGRQGGIGRGFVRWRRPMDL